eukprot:2896104-Heterocapsa_arctica.AAC.1
MPGNAGNRRQQNLAGHTVTTRLRDMPPPRMQRAGIKTWGSHLVQSHIDNTYYCTKCNLTT